MTENLSQTHTSCCSSFLYAGVVSKAECVTPKSWCLGASKSVVPGVAYSKRRSVENRFRTFAVPLDRTDMAYHSSFQSQGYSNFHVFKKPTCETFARKVRVRQCLLPKPMSDVLPLEHIQRRSPGRADTVVRVLRRQVSRSFLPRMQRVSVTREHLL